MQGAKRKIKARALVQDLRSEMSDEAIMAKYSVSPKQFEKLLWRLVEAGAITEMEIYQRTSVSESTVTRAFADTAAAVESQLIEQTEIDPSTEVECTEVIDLSDASLAALVNKFRRAWGKATDDDDR